MKQRSKIDQEGEESVPTGTCGTISAAIPISEGSKADEDEHVTPTPRFQIAQKVLARDSDGLLYAAFVRRLHFGQPQQLKLGILSTLEAVDNENFVDEMDDTSIYTQPQWFYFLHFDGWKVNWDRWSSEQDILEYTDHHLEWQRTIQTEHKALLKQHKQNGKKVDGAEFLKAWKPKLEALMKAWQGTNAKNKTIGGGSMKKRKVLDVDDLLEQEHAMRTQHLVSRPANDREQIQLPSGLKRILVEEWEILTGPFSMVHVLDPKVSVRRVLDDYVKSKGACLTTDGLDGKPTQTDPGNSIETGPSQNVDNHLNGPNVHSTEEDLEEINCLNKGWTDMQKGILQLFNQALPTRLLYPREQAQLHAFLDADNAITGGFGSVATTESSTASREPCNYYGCAHLLRLCCQLPGLLSEQYDPKDEELQHILVKPMLAKINDLLRFLQAHQAQYFPQNFRKLAADEEKLEQKWIKRYERKQTMAMDECTNNDVEKD